MWLTIYFKQFKIIENIKTVHCRINDRRIAHARRFPNIVMLFIKTVLASW